MYSDLLSMGLLISLRIVEEVTSGDLIGRTKVVRLFEFSSILSFLDFEIIQFVDVEILRGSFVSSWGSFPTIVLDDNDGHNIGFFA